MESVLQCIEEVKYEARIDKMDKRSNAPIIGEIAITGEGKYLRYYKQFDTKGKYNEQ